MNENAVSLIISVFALIIVIIALISKNSNKTEEAPVLSSNRFDAIPLQLQAYERLAILCERIALPNLISRTSQPDLSARAMQTLLIEHIKQEFEYNASQQIYVSPVIWEYIRNLRDQNILLVNQVANILPQDAGAKDLNKQLVEIIMNQQEAALHTIVLNALNFEA
ncbi:MAG: hypothetical protein C4329_14400, partial [Chitinophagaceae bacterium]